jgi:hypothetical protein
LKDAVFGFLRSLVVLVLLFAAAAATTARALPPHLTRSGVAYSQTDLTVGTGAEAIPATASVQHGGWFYSETAADHRARSSGQPAVTWSAARSSSRGSTWL